MTLDSRMIMRVVEALDSKLDGGILRMNCWFVCKNVRKTSIVTLSSAGLLRLPMLVCQNQKAIEPAQRQPIVGLASVDRRCQGFPEATA